MLTIDQSAQLTITGGFCSFVWLLPGIPPLVLGHGLVSSTQLEVHVPISKAAPRPVGSFWESDSCQILQ